MARGGASRPAPRGNAGQRQPIKRGPVPDPYRQQPAPAKKAKLDDELGPATTSAALRSHVSSTGASSHPNQPPPTLPARPVFPFDALPSEILTLVIEASGAACFLKTLGSASRTLRSALLPILGPHIQIKAEWKQVMFGCSDLFRNNVQRLLLRQPLQLVFDSEELSDSMKTRPHVLLPALRDVVILQQDRLPTTELVRINVPAFCWILSQLLEHTTQLSLFDCKLVIDSSISDDARQTMQWVLNPKHNGALGTPTLRELHLRIVDATSSSLRNKAVSELFSSLTPIHSLVRLAVHVNTKSFKSNLLSAPCDDNDYSRTCPFASLVLCIHNIPLLEELCILSDKNFRKKALDEACVVKHVVRWPGRLHTVRAPCTEEALDRISKTLETPWNKTSVKRIAIDLQPASQLVFYNRTSSHKWSSTDARPSPPNWMRPFFEKLDALESMTIFYAEYGLIDKRSGMWDLSAEWTSSFLVTREAAEALWPRKEDDAAKDIARLPSSELVDLMSHVAHGEA